MKVIREQPIRKNLILKLIQLSPKLFSTIILDTFTNMVYSHDLNYNDNNTTEGMEYVAIRGSKSTAYRRFNSIIEEQKIKPNEEGILLRI